MSHLCGSFDPSTMAPARRPSTLYVAHTPPSSIPTPPRFLGYDLFEMGRMQLSGARSLVRENLPGASDIVRRMIGRRCEGVLKYRLRRLNQDHNIDTLQTEVSGLINDIILFQLFLTPNVLQKCVDCMSRSGFQCESIRHQSHLHSDIQIFGDQSYAPSSSERQGAYERLVQAMENKQNWRKIRTNLEDGGDEAEFIRQRIGDVFIAYKNRKKGK
ncbi:MAG: hypothetical protein WC753_01295 [Candidatus Gracilibacteria bacterium]